MIVEIPNDYIDSWMKTQQQAFATLRDQALQMQSYFQNNSAATDNPFTNWAKASFQAFPMGADADLTKDIFSKTLYGNDAMQKLYELCSAEQFSGFQLLVFLLQSTTPNLFFAN